MEFKRMAKVVEEVIDSVENLYEVEKDARIELSEDGEKRTADALFWLYVESIPSEHNPIYRKRREYDCSECSHFIKNIGWTVDENGKSIWTLAADKVEFPFNEVFKKMGQHVESKPVIRRYTTNLPKVGSTATVCSCEDHVETFDHFFYDVKNSGSSWYTNELGVEKNKLDSGIESLKKAIEEYDEGIIDSVLELIDDGLYRGDQYEDKLLDLKKAYKEYIQAERKDLWFAKNWNRPSAKLRSLVIYTLVQDLREGKSLAEAEKSYLQKVDPSNYQRVKSVASSRQIKEAKEFIKENGYQDSLFRVHATLNEIPNELFIWKKAENINKDEIDNLFDELPSKNKSNKIQKDGKQITLAELKSMIENNEVNSLEVAKPEDMTAYLSTAKYKNSKELFPWGHLSWTYSGGVADSIFKRVDKSVRDAGGNINARFKVSLAWYSCDDLDLHMYTPNDDHIYYSNKHPRNTNWQLDIDMNAGNCSNGVNPIENIFTNNPESGEYVVKVNNYRQRAQSVQDIFHVTLKFDNKIYVVEYPQRLHDSKTIEICTFVMKERKLHSIAFNGELKLLSSEDSLEYKEVTGVITSPNKEGLKHTFFILNDFDKNIQGKERGFFVEQLKPELKQHKRVFEILADKLRFELDPKGVVAVGISEGRKDLKLPIRINGRPYILVSK